MDRRRRADDPAQPPPVQPERHKGESATVADSPDGEVVPSPAPLDALRAEIDELRRRVAVSDDEIDMLQVEAATPERRWYREPGVLVSAFAIVVTFGFGQANITSDREIAERTRL